MSSAYQMKPIAETGRMPLMISQIYLCLGHRRGSIFTSIFEKPVSAPCSSAFTSKKRTKLQSPAILGAYKP
jgi:hypothetical protein